MQVKDESRESTIEWLNKSAKSLRKWVDSVRPADGSRGRFLWAHNTTRPANVAATSYILAGLHKIGAADLITDEDKVQGIKWVEAMHIGNQQYRDPALLERRPTDWPADRNWPDAQTLVVINQYAQGVLKNLGLKNLSPPPPPEGIPPVSEVENALDWIKSRPWKENPWGAGSWGMRMATWLLQWYKEGKISIDPFIEALKWFYETQDPETGLWGGKEAGLYQRINGTFKLFVLLQDQLCLPLPYVEKVIDQILFEWARPDYDEHVGGCDEWDNLYVVALAAQHTDERKEELEKALLHRLNRFRIFEQQDGGLSYSPGCCGPTWVGIDMAPSIPQGDSLGLGVLSAAVNVCVDLLGLKAESPWTGEWRLRQLEDENLRKDIIKRIGL